MRIGIFHSTLPTAGRKIGGVELFAHRLANSLNGRGHAVALYSFARNAPEDARYVLRRVGRDALVRSTASRLVLGPAVLNRIDSDGLDVLNLHGDDWLYVRRKCASVRTFHGSALSEARSATRWQRKLAQALVYPAELAASRLATASYTVCVGMPPGYRLAGTLPQGGGLFPEAVGVDRSLPRSAHPTVLFVGTWEGRKRGRMLRDAFRAEVIPRHPSARLVMVSDRCEECEHVCWVREPDDRTLSELYATSWLFCLPSIYEGFGQPYVEAMAHGTPVVSTPNPGIDYVSRQGRMATVVPDEALGGTLADLLADEVRRRRLATLGEQRALDFGWDAACAAHERAFELAAEDFARSRRGRRTATGWGSTPSR
jgi:glycosyltransferase involved in cell wall biosynthesis